MTEEFCLTEQVLGKNITARVTRLDAGLAVLLTGGERSHIGAEASGTQVWVACGIHYDNLSREGLEQVIEACDQLLEHTAAALGKEWTE